jgi:hypothetical protein
VQFFFPGLYNSTHCVPACLFFTVLFVFLFFSLLNMVQFLFSFNRSILLFPSLPPQAPFPPPSFCLSPPSQIKSTRTAFPPILLVCFFLLLSFFLALIGVYAKKHAFYGRVVSCRVVSCSIRLCWDVWMAWSFRGMNDIYPCAPGIQKANNRTWHGNVICENTGLYWFRTDDDRNSSMI